MNTTRQTKALEWAAQMFGIIALDRETRVARMLEEVFELAQAADFPKEKIAVLVEHVYAKPAGSALAELGAVGLTFEMLAENLGVDSDYCTELEWRRVLAIDPEVWARRHQNKIDAGVSKAVP